MHCYGERYRIVGPSEILDFYGAHESEVAGTSLFTGACPKQN